MIVGRYSLHPGKVIVLVPTGIGKAVTEYHVIGIGFLPATREYQAMVGKRRGQKETPRPYKLKATFIRPVPILKNGTGSQFGINLLARSGQLMGPAQEVGQISCRFFVGRIFKTAGRQQRVKDYTGTEIQRL